MDVLPAFADLPTVTLPALCTVPDVELLRVGDQWHPAGGANQPDGTLRVTSDDLTVLVAAGQDRTLPRPVLKLGHTDPRFQAAGDLDTGFPHGDGQPALGRLVNLRLAEEGTSLRCDVFGIPAWLAYLWPSAFPHRSIEWLPGDWMSAWYPQAARHPLVLTGLALLGEAWPAIAVLDDVPALFGISPTPITLPSEAPMTRALPKPQAAGGPGMAAPVQVPPAPPPAPAAAVTTDEVRQLIYDREESWGWVVEFEAGPDGLAAIYEDGSGDMWRIPVTVGADDAITLGEAVPVRMVFVQTTDDGRTAPLAASLAAVGSRRTIARFAPANPAQVRTTRTSTDARLTVPDPTPTETEEASTMTPEQLEAIGLPADATPEQIDARLAELVALDIPPAGDEGGDDPDAGGDGPDPGGTVDTPVAGATVTVSAQQWRDTQAQLAQLAARDDERTRREQTAHRDAVIATAVSSGRITPAERADWRTALDEAPEATEALLTSLAPGRRVPVTEQGYAGESADDADARYAQLTAGAPTYDRG